ncbi:MAG: hypothetical protein ACRD4W_12185 [Nitrososphaeraceae archaeon]
MGVSTLYDDSVERGNPCLMSEPSNDCEAQFCGFALTLNPGVV